jgi:hypothetical protein
MLLSWLSDEKEFAGLLQLPEPSGFLPEKQTTAPHKNFNVISMLSSW